MQKINLLWRGDRVAYGNGLLNHRIARFREFESRPLRQKIHFCYNNFHLERSHSGLVRMS